MSNWEKLKSAGTVIASVFVPIAVVLIGNSYSSAVKESETSVQYIELAVDILEEEPTGEDDNMRHWALNIINEYSAVPLDTLTRNEFLHGSLFKELDDEIDNNWLPNYVRTEVAQPLALQRLRKVLDSGDELAAQEAITDMIRKATHDLDKRKDELKDSLRTAKSSNPS